MAGGDFAREKWDLLNRASSDPRLTDAQFRVIFRIMSYVNCATGDAWPSQGRIAADCGLTQRGVRKCIAALEAAGYLAITSGKRRGVSSVYRPMTPKPLTDPETANGGSQEVRTGVPTNNMNELFEEHSCAHARVNERDEDREAQSDFGALWALYPNHEDELVAWEEYLTARSVAGAATIIEKAREALAAERERAAQHGNRKPVFPKLSNWLRRQKWRPPGAALQSCAPPTAPIGAQDRDRLMKLSSRDPRYGAAIVAYRAERGRSPPIKDDAAILPIRLVDAVAQGKS